MHFTRLRLTGFKSFVETTDLLIEPGLTAVVGPNGCGKSNLVEALRWVMGEGSARKLRGREMDDVIFGGSASRPQRNHAEVSVLLDNAARTAPDAFNEYSEIEVSRRIERGEGSVYRINGRELRARDVQLLFADETTGSRSTALVSQGEIGALIAAKPIQRRGLLEEAAGVTGLHSRRHEAELRLRAAENNLERLDDVMGALEAQFQGLKRQARQAKRYRRVSERIRETEAMLLLRRWHAAEDGVLATERALDEAQRRVVELETAAAAAAAERTGAAAELPPLREAAAAAGAELHRLEVAQVSLEAEERRLAEMRNALETRLGQIDADVEREKVLAGDAAEAVARLDDESAALSAAQAGEAEAERRAAAARAEAAETVVGLEAEVDALTGRIAAEEVRRAALERQIEDLGLRIERLRGRAVEVDDALAALAAETGGRDDRDAADAAVTRARDDLGSRRATADAAEREHESRQVAERSARETWQAAETAHAALAAEESALAELLDKGGRANGPTLIDAVNVEAGLEAALAAALGDDLAASPDETAPMHWRALAYDGEPPPLPDEAAPLSGFVEAPPALARRLSQVGVVDGREGARLQAALVQGQRLVGRDGALWRWDGFTVAPEAETPAATRLRQKNRLGVVRDELAANESRRAEAKTAFEAAAAALEETRDSATAARAALRTAEDALDAAREARARANESAAAESSRRANLRAAAERLAGDLAEAEEARAVARDAQDALPTGVEGRAQLEDLRRRLAERRAVLAERDHTLDRLRREATARRDRLAAIATDLESWRTRAGGADQRLAQLAERRAAAETDLTALADRPAEIARERTALFEQLAAAQAARRRANDTVVEAETRLAACDERLKGAEAAAAGAREERVRCEGALGQARATRDEVARAVDERLGCAPSELAGLAGVDDAAETPELDEIEARLARLLRERENIGAVNLRAETEAAEVEEQLSALRDERSDLEAAIARLRQAIGRLNREARERLETAFRTINDHFGALFTRLFAGGRAYLNLIDSDDPLEAGLEIMASPPGKRLQMLSLLSGGEQALTALALMFAVFLTKPAPICVLDEVDASLDDANVERFCDLIDEIAHQSATRFLVVTHHRLTMARMDRLFGVTMSERGVSQLVSVDLRTAEELRATA
ncbi:MAG: chromosome segregation protein SMC [Alphaproteobacteria bacterium]